MPRPPKPVEHHKLVGTFRHDRHGNAPTVKPERIDPPAWLAPEAREHWPAIADALFGLNLLAQPYSVALALLVDALADFVQYSKLAASAPPVLTSGNGSSYQNPIIGLKNKSWARVLKASREFGMTPASINAASGKAKPAPATGLAAFKLRRTDDEPA